MNHCKICGNNIPDEVEDCHQAGFGEGCMKNMRTMNQIQNIEEEIRFNPRAGGKEILTDKKIVEEVRKGDNYVVWKSPKNTVHIIPDGKLRDMFHHQLQKAKEEEKERIMRWSSSNYSRSTQPLYAHVDLLELQNFIKKPDIQS